jgi:catechol 2,3-dioxygenase-like lactoylglutathione lyase family enzyme
VTTSDQLAGVRYLVVDVQAAIDFYTTHLGFTLRSHPVPPSRT